MDKIKKDYADSNTPPVVREYDIDGVKYIVKATVKAGATEDAADIVRRLLRNAVSKQQTN